MESPNNSFWHAALLYIYRPNLLNKRLLGAKLKQIWNLSGDEHFDIEELFINKKSTSIKHLNSLFEKKIICDKNNILNFCNQSSNRESEHEQQQQQSKCQTILIVRKLFRKQSLKSLLNTSNDQSNINNNCCCDFNNNIEYDLICLWPILNKFIIIPINIEPVVVNDFENSDHVQINIRKESDDIAFIIKLIDDDDENFHLELLFPSFYDDENNGQRQESQLWLKNVFKQKLERWIRQNNENKQQNNDNNNKYEGSIKQISVENYCENYNRLKQKYVQSLMKIWNSIENTDPIKFIYEDIAIAAYLITMWNNDEQINCQRQRKPTFADIGCGNGLLVYILTKEGYNGYGIDLRKRNIWNQYNNIDFNNNDKKVRLIEMKIDLLQYENTDDFNLPQHCDWMIGNHSDELTPWIIYMASMQNFRTNVFLLPCCCYNFDGFKFQRTSVGTMESSMKKSQYQCYIDFLEHLGYEFGFDKCRRDKLRIPSTKRICLIFTGRSYCKNIDEKLNKQMIEMIEMETKWKEKRRQIVRQSIMMKQQKQRLRDINESVRNCTRIDQKIKQKIITILSNELINKNNNNNNNNDCTYDQSSLDFQEAMKLLENSNITNDNDNDDIRKHLKNQYGGLQTFIRNHKFIFTIKNGGQIKFQSIDYLKKSQNNSNSNNNNNNCGKKIVDCWFYQNHPNGCPVIGECKFLHRKL